MCYIFFYTIKIQNLSKYFWSIDPSENILVKHQAGQVTFQQAMSAYFS